MQRMKIFRQFSPAVTLFLARMAAFSASRWHSASARKNSFRDKSCSLKTKLGCGLGLQAAKVVNNPINRMRNMAGNNQGLNNAPKSELEKDRERQLNTLIDLSETFALSLFLDLG
jgi:hypothetical protein